MVVIETAGGVFVPLDPTAPKARLQNILEDTKATMAVASPSCESVLQGLGIEVCVVDEALLYELSDPPSAIIASSKPDNSSVVLLTSGSTGKPKGMVIQYNSICLSSDAYGANLGIGPGRRVF